MMTNTEEEVASGQKPEARLEPISLAITGGLSAGAKLRENRIFAVSPTGLAMQGEMTLEQWREVMRMVKFTKSAAALWLADLIRHGRQQFGEEVVKETLIQMEFALEDAQKAIAIERLDDGVRHVALTSEHYWVLSKCGARNGESGTGRPLSREEQVEWARLAVKHELTALQLQKSITAGKVITQETMTRNRGGASGLATPHGIRQQYELWFAQVAQNDPIESWDLDRKKELWEELRGPVELGVRLARELGISLEVAR